MKTFLHYTKEKELDEAFFKNLGKRLNSAGSSIMAGANRARSAATNTAGAVRRAGSSSIGSTLLSAARGVAVTAFKSASGERLGGAIKGGVNAAKSGKRILNTTACEAGAARASSDARKGSQQRELEMKILEKEISTGNRHYSRGGSVVEVLVKDSSGKKVPEKLSAEEVQQAEEALKDTKKEHPLVTKLDNEDATLKRKKCSFKGVASRFIGVNNDEDYQS